MGQKHVDPVDPDSDTEHWKTLCEVSKKEHLAFTGTYHLGRSNKTVFCSWKGEAHSAFCAQSASAATKQ
jgi:hypothetical protein